MGLTDGLATGRRVEKEIIEKSIIEEKTFIRHSAEELLWPTRDKGEKK